MDQLMSESESNIVLAKWTDRFLAWLIDFIIISIISTSIIFLSFGTIDYEFNDDGFLGGKHPIHSN